IIGIERVPRDRSARRIRAGRPFVMHEMRSRALGALYGLAIGDALGMPAQSLPRADIVARYGPLVGEFCPGPDGHPLAAGLPAGSVTDDTEQALLLARLVVAGGGGGARRAPARAGARAGGGEREAGGRGPVR